MSARLLLVSAVTGMSFAILTSGAEAQTDCPNIRGVYNFGGFSMSLTQTRDCMISGRFDSTKFTHNLEARWNGTNFEGHVSRHSLEANTSCRMPTQVTPEQPGFLRMASSAPVGCHELNPGPLESARWTKQ